MGVQVVIISVQTKERFPREPSLYKDKWSLAENPYPFFESLDDDIMDDDDDGDSYHFCGTEYMTNNVLKCFTTNASSDSY